MATFNEKILGAKCDVNILVDLATGEASVAVLMRQMLSQSPAFRISRDDLAALSSCIKAAKLRADVLDEKSEGVTDHQMNCACGGSSLIVVKPTSKPARFTLNVGLFHREGSLDQLSAKEIDEAVSKLDALAERVALKARQ